MGIRCEEPCAKGKLAEFFYAFRFPLNCLVNLKVSMVPDVEADARNAKTAPSVTTSQVRGFQSGVRTRCFLMFIECRSVPVLARLAGRGLLGTVPAQHLGHRMRPALHLSAQRHLQGERRPVPLPRRLDGTAVQRK